MQGSRSYHQLVAESQTVLIVEDEPAFVEALTVALKREGFLVKVATNGIEALAEFDAVRPDIVLLDIMLPGLSGLDVCREIRSKSTVPIIITSAKGSEIDTVVGLEVGADDYMTKPYRVRELAARMRAALRRTPLEEVVDDGAVLDVGGIRMDRDRHEVWVRGNQVTFPLKEFELLEALLENVGRVLSRDALMNRVWGPHYYGDTKTLDVHIKRLRSKIEVDPSAPKYITTIRGLGYRLEAPESGPA